MTRPDNDAIVRICIDMANRYDEDIEGCDADELTRFGEGIRCCYRLAYIFKYGKMPPQGEAWGTEFSTLAKNLSRDDSAIREYAALNSMLLERAS